MHILFLNQLLSPDVGLLFWTTCAFLIFMWLLAKYAWKPLLRGVRDREKLIAESLNNAKIAEDKMLSARREYEEMMREAQAEKKRVIDEAEKSRLKVVEDARVEAKRAAAKVMEDAKVEIAHAQQKAQEELKKEVVDLVLEVSEKVLQEHFADAKNKRKYVDKILQTLS